VRRVLTRSSGSQIAPQLLPSSSHELNADILLRGGV